MNPIPEDLEAENQDSVADTRAEFRQPGIAEPDIIHRAIKGDEQAFATLVNIYRARVRNVIRKMVGHPDDTDDLFQETLLKANNALGSFKGDANFGTWLCAIAVNLSLDFLRRQKTWRTRAQVIYGNACFDDPQHLGSEVQQALSSLEFQFDVHEHIAYCWSCVARSVPPEENAALVYREFLGMGNRESAKEMGMSESVFRHTLSRARKRMQESFDDLCALVSKTGVCYQCIGLRDGCASASRGAEVPQQFTLEERIRFVGDAELDCGKSQSMHDLFYRRTNALEAQDFGDACEGSRCTHHQPRWD